VIDATRATAEVLEFLGEGHLPSLAGGRIAFVNFDSQHLREGSAFLFDPGLLGVEVLESVVAGPETESSLRKLRAAGYRIALDDYRPSRTPELLDVSNLVKVDVQTVRIDELPPLVAAARRAGVTLLAEKVETRAEYHRYRKLGFSLFQGYYFARPEPVAGDRVEGDRHSLVQLLAALYDPGLSMDRLAAVVSANASLTTKVLRFLNSAAIGLPRKVASIHEAVVLVGTNRLRQWTSLLVLSSFTHKPRHLLEMALVRARMCELQASDLGGDPNTFFTVGVLSVADALSDRTMDQLVATLPVTEEVAEALVSGRGPAGEALRTAVAFEGRLQFDAALQGRRLAETYLKSLAWAEELLGLLSDRSRPEPALAG
jgi:EAL and modified HD-GYP domain-containing signal transduction protein